MFAIVTIGVVLWSIFPRAAKFPDPGIRLDEKDQPQLWQLVRKVAQQAGQQPPRDLFLVGDINAFVAERGSRMGFGGTRVMGIGLPLLQVLTVPQLQSVVAHEFGHFHGGDTRLGPLIWRTRDSIGRTIVNFQKTESLLSKPFEWYGNLFLRVTFAISRAQEFAADALSVRLCGKQPVQSALRRVNETGPLFDHYLQTEFLPVLNRKLRPPLAAGFGTYLASPGIRDLQVKVGEEAMQAKGNPYDSHPPLQERLAAAAAVDGAGNGPADGPVAVTLLRDVDAVEARLLAFLTEADEVAKLPRAQWQEVLVPTVVENWARIAREHGRKLPAMRVADFAVPRDRLDELARKIDPKIPAVERPAAAGWLLGVLLGSALLRAGWTVVTGLGEPVHVVLGDARLEPTALGRQLAEGKLDATAFATTCSQLGIGDLVLAGPDLPIG
ncbi:MAG: M48 family metallopeptidase [Planctomycetes bacterium]|nr:M48 family metallopeptidase [Planctomycetota bacterium]